MTSKSFDLFDREIPTSPPPTLAAEGEAHSKLKRNLSKALDVHDKILDADLPPDLPHGDKRLMLEAANATVKAALATDRAVLKARTDNVLELVFLRVLFHRKINGDTLTDQELTRLTTAPRKDIEAALVSPRLIAQYDDLVSH